MRSFQMRAFQIPDFQVPAIPRIPDFQMPRFILPRLPDLGFMAEIERGLAPLRAAIRVAEPIRQAIRAARIAEASLAKAPSFPVVFPREG